MCFSFHLHMIWYSLIWYSLLQYDAWYELMNYKLKWHHEIWYLFWNMLNGKILSIHWLVQGNYRNIPYFMGKPMVSCRFSLKSTHWSMCLGYSHLIFFGQVIRILRLLKLVRLLKSSRTRLGFPGRLLDFQEEKPIKYQHVGFF